MLKWIRSIAIVLTVVSIFVLSPQTTRADDPPGAKLFGTYCAGCHGGEGKGGGALAIGSAQYLNANDDAKITRVTSEGAVSKGMPAWSKAKGGALSDDQIANVVVYLRSLATTGNASTASAPSSVFLTETKMFATQSVNAEGETMLTALLQDYTGFPVAGASIAFTRATLWGFAEVGTARTGANGIATFMVPELPSSAREMAVAFNGDKKFSAAAAKIALVSQVETASSPSHLNLSGIHLSIEEPLLSPEGSLITPNPPLLLTVLIVLVVSCVWATYGFVFYQAYGILKHGRTQSRENTLKNRGR